jgi:hypothetical protein
VLWNIVFFEERSEEALELYNPPIPIPLPLPPLLSEAPPEFLSSLDEIPVDLPKNFESFPDPYVYFPFCPFYN